MSEIVFEGNGRAVIHHTGTGQEMTCSVPTALENVALSGGVWAHGHKPAGLVAKAPAPVAEPEPVIPLVEDDVLPLPAPEPEPEFRDVADLETLDQFLAEEANADLRTPAPPAVDPLDHDGNGKKGGARKPIDPERAAIIAALKAAQIKFFVGWSTERLKALLPA